MKENKKILFIGLKKDKISNKMIFYLKQNFSSVSISHSSKQFNTKYKNKKFDLVINYRSKIILKKNFLDNNYKKVINFHPSSQEYRGIGCVNYAFIKKSKIYGAVCHLIDEKIDHGEIIDARYFDINQKDNLSSVLKKSYLCCLQMFYILVQRYIKNSMYIEYMINLNRNVKWGRKLYTKKKMLKLYNISRKNLIKLKKDEFNHLYLATSFSKHKLILNIFGQKFKLIKIDEKK